MRGAARTGYGFGTFKGVFTPSILTILGVIMFLRFGWVLGQVGLGRTLLIVGLSTGITLLTAVSLAALATNMRVAGGGAYFIISRSLGAETGAAVGVPLYLAQAIGVAFYLAGFAESVAATFPGLEARTVALVALGALTLITWFSADLALRTQYAVMAAIAISLAAFFLGRPLPAAAGDPALAPVARLPFWAVFAVFFPAVTGIEAGIAMSGDLKDPARSLPRGTFAAILTGLAVYVAIPILLHLRVADPERLLREPLIMREVARWGWPIVLGVWGASLSSAVGAMLGAPRTLQALSRDRAAPRLFGRGYGRGDEPRLAALASFAVALLAILAGGIDAIAPVLSMFFLTSYACLNLAASLETLVAVPHWRPTFRAHWGVSLFGAAACVGVMLMINAGAALVALACCALIFATMKRRQARARWGDLWRAFWGWTAGQALLRLDRRPVDERSWTPNLLVLSGLPSERWYLVEVADAIARGRGLTTVAMVLPEDATPERTATAQRAVRDYLRRHDVEAFVKLLPAGDPLEGARLLVDNYGFGPLAPNTVLLGDTGEPGRRAAYAAFLMRLQRQRRNVLVVREGPELSAEGEEAPGPAPGAAIDVWWEGKGPNAWFMLAIAYQLSLSPDWRAAPLRLNSVVRDPEERAPVEARLRERIAAARVPAEGRVLVGTGGDVFATIREASRDARLCILGMRPCGEEETPEAYAAWLDDLLRRAGGLPLTAFVLASERVDFSRIFQ